MRGEYDLQPILTLDEQRRQLEQERVVLQTRSNDIGKLVGDKIKSGCDPKGEEIKALREEGQQIKIGLSELEPKEKEIDAQINQLLLLNSEFTSESTVGKDERENLEIRRWGDKYIPTNPNILHHADIGEKLNILEFKQAVKVAQARFVALKGAGAALERALIQFMLDRHTNNGYLEVIPPLLVNSTSNSNGTIA